MNVLSILPWNTCVARCDHCGPQSGPKDKTEIDHMKVLQLINDIGDKNKNKESRWCLSLSGGEIFLHYNRLLEYASLAYSLNGYTTLITNCFWAKDHQTALEKLLPLKKNGLMIMGVSISIFHQKYIEIERVATALKAANELGIKCHVRAATNKDSRLSDLIKALDKYQLWFVDYMEMPVVPSGRAKYKISRETLYLSLDLPKGTCPAASLTINPKGEAMICCNGAGEHGLNVGTIYNKTLDQINNSFLHSALIKFLQQKGPVACIDFLTDEEREFFLSNKYVSVCHLCNEIFHDEHRRERLVDSIYNSTLSKVKINGCSLEDLWHEYNTGYEEDVYYGVR